MKTLNKDIVDVLFRREAVLIGNMDVVPKFRVADLFGTDAADFAVRQGFWNGYGVGDYTFEYITHKGFQAAASYFNVQRLREVNQE